MGDSTPSEVKIYDEAEVTNLSKESRIKLREHVLKQINEDKEIQDLVRAKVKPFRDLLT
jgi:hypothetical protein